MSFIAITANFAGVKYRYATLEGRRCIVAPMVMLTEGVHNGSQGALYYGGEELAKFPGVWDHKPVVVYHPVQNNQPVTACSPAMLEKRKVGVVLNTHWDGKLRAEAWLDEEKLLQVDPRVHTAILAGTVVEVSTGLHVETVPVANGVWNGERYDAMAVNFRPDHLAILPDQVGACSIEDGAGLLQTNAAGTKSFEDLRQALEKAVTQRYGVAAWVVDTYAKSVIFRAPGQSELQMLAYAQDKDIVTLAPDTPTVVYRRTEYRTADGVVANVTTPPNKEIEMKKALVDGLIANTATKWTEADRAFLEGLTEEQLGKFAPVANTEQTPPATPQTPAQAEPAPKAQQPAPAAEPVANAAPKAPTAQEYIAAAPESIREVLNAGMQAAQAERQRLVSTIVANEKNTFAEADLNAMPLASLLAVAALAVNAAPAPQPFYGVGQPAQVDNSYQPTPLPVPKFDFTKK